MFSLAFHSNHVETVSLNPDGTCLARSSWDWTAKVWDVSSGVPEGGDRVLHILSSHTTLVLGAAFSPDGRRLATAGTDAATRIWDAVSGQELLTPVGHRRAVFDLAYTPDGTRLATASFDGTIRVYVVPIEDLVALAESRVTRSLTSEECRKFLHLEQCPTAP